MKKRKTESGFITLFFILGISFTFLSWISLSSERIFEYVSIKKEFARNRSTLQGYILCADSFVDNTIRSRYSLKVVGGIYDFNRSLYFADNYICHISDIRFIYQSNSVSTIFFISGGFTFEYQFKNGFVDYIKSSALF